MAFQTELDHLLNGQALTLLMRLNRLADEWRLRVRNGEAPHPAMLSEHMTLDELTEATAVLGRAFADALEREHADGERQKLAVVQAQERRQAELLRKYPAKASGGGKRPTAEMVVG